MVGAAHLVSAGAVSGAWRRPRVSPASRCTAFHLHTSRKNHASICLSASAPLPNPDDAFSGATQLLSDLSSLSELVLGRSSSRSHLTKMPLRTWEQAQTCCRGREGDSKEM